MKFTSLLPGFARARTAAALGCLSALAAATPALGQHMPYEPLAVSYDTSAAEDAPLRALIETLRAAVAEKNLAAIDAELSPAVMAFECDADPVKPCPDLAPVPAVPAAAPAPVKIAGLSKPVRISRSVAARVDARLAAMLKLPPAQRLRAGLCCRDVPVQHITRAMREEAVLGFIGAALEEETIGAHPGLPGAACMPAWPVFDRAKAALLATSADIETGNLRVATTELALRGKPAKDAGEVARIGSGQIAAFVTDAVDSLPDGWSSIALPQGGLGFTDQGGLADLTPAGVCFAKDDAGKWKISAVIQRHS